MNLEKHRQEFENYAREKIRLCLGDPSPMYLKLHHSMQVLENAFKITSGENFDPAIARLVHLAALYHDIGRFEQYLKYGTFRDRESCNHGLLSEMILKKLDIFHGVESDSVHIIYTAIALHNRPKLPPILPEKYAQVANVVRDADKLDILRVMDEHLSGDGPYNPTVILSLPDRKDIYSQKLVESILNKKNCSYNDLLTVDDFRLLLGSWIYSLNFESSRRIAINGGHALSIVKKLPDNKFYYAVKNKLLQDLKV